ncbi:unnamed protein product, partial [Polarella glacialis]
EGTGEGTGEGAGKHQDTSDPASTTPQPAPGRARVPASVCADDCKDEDWLTCHPALCDWAKPYCPCTCGICGQALNCTCKDPNGFVATSSSDGCVSEGQEMCKCNVGYRKCDYDEETAGTCGAGSCVPLQCHCDPFNGESMGSFADIPFDAVGPACWQDQRGGCQKKCNSEDCDAANPVFLGAQASQQCAGVAKGLLGSGCCASSECCSPADPSDSVWGSTSQGPVPVDFIVFKRSKDNRFFSWDEYSYDAESYPDAWSDPNKKLVKQHLNPATACEDVPDAEKGQVPCVSGLPWSTSNMGGVDGCSGFCRAVALPKALPFNGTGLTHCNNPFDFDREIAVLTVVDMNNDFAQLGVKGATFVLGDFREVEGDSALGSIDELIGLTEGDGLPGSPTGHDLLYRLTGSQEPADALFPKPGRVTMWIPNTEIVAATECYDKTTWQAVEYDAQKEKAEEIVCIGMRLLGSTFLGMPLSSSSDKGPRKGPGAIMAAECQRRGHRYSHEMGHIVGFEHAGYDSSPGAPYGVNIMGGGAGDANSSPVPQSTFTAGAVKPQLSYPSIFADWRARQQGAGSPQEPEPGSRQEPEEDAGGQHAEESFLEKTEKKVDVNTNNNKKRASLSQHRRQATQDKVANCRQLEARFGKDVLQHVLRAGKMQCAQ